ncbi:MAG TPA: hypothetical protein VF426_07660 [Marmoricola sp.]
MTRPDTLLIGTYPRDDIKWPDDGVARDGLIEILVGLEDDIVASQRIGEFFPPLSPDLEVGSRFTLRITATMDAEHFSKTYAFVVTGDEDDGGQYTLGPGMHVERGRWGRKTVSGFEFGATVMGAAISPVV